MKIAYTARQFELAPAQKAKLEEEFSKLSKVLDGRVQKEVHVVLSQERHLIQAEVTLHLRDRELVGIGSAPDLLVALRGAVGKLEKQALKTLAKKRDVKRTPRKNAVAAAAAAPAPEAETEVRIFRPNGHSRRKPMTVEEAMLSMDKKSDYLAFRDAATDRLSVLVRRRDGHFDLIEG